MKRRRRNESVEAHGFGEQCEQLIVQNGLPELFDRQCHLWPPAKETGPPDLQRWVEFIDRTGKGLEQEVLLRTQANGDGEQTEKGRNG